MNAASIFAGVRGAIVVRLSQSNYTVEESSGISVCLSVTDTSNSSFIDLLFLTVGGTATGKILRSALRVKVKREAIFILPMIKSSTVFEMYKIFKCHIFSRYCSEGVDYTLIANHTLQLPPLGGSGPLPSEHCLPVFQLCEDSIPEDDENFTISLTSPNTPALMLQKNFTVHIIDDDSKKQNSTNKNIFKLYIISCIVLNIF